MVLVILALVGCSTTTSGRTASESPTDTPPAVLSLSDPDLARGQQVWLDKHCIDCHGDIGQGGIGPELSLTSLPFDEFLHKVRTALPPKPAFNSTELTDQDTYNIYEWLQISSEKTSAMPLNQSNEPQLSDGQILGMALWTQYECDQCHGAFAQGSATAPTLAGITYPYEMERANMRLTGEEIPQHQAEFIRDVILKRLYNWLQSGADSQGGC